MGELITVTCAECSGRFSTTIFNTSEKAILRYFHGRASFDFIGFALTFGWINCKICLQYLKPLVIETNATKEYSTLLNLIII